MLMFVPMVKLHDHLACEEKLLILRAAVTTLKAQNDLIPTAAHSDIVDGNEWLEFHAVAIPMMRGRAGQRLSSTAFDTGMCLATLRLNCIRCGV
ncbi:MAG: hypothetical protein ACI9DC_004136 [Gammaproteobacteria bacterium]|jgi:hypothetical protein